MNAKEAIANELKEAGRGAQANLEGKAAQYSRQDTQAHSHVQTDAGEARKQAAEAQQQHHAAAHADYEAQQNAREAEAEAQADAQQQEPDPGPVQENNGPEYGD
jgi:glucose repression mediator protein